MSTELEDGRLTVDYARLHETSPGPTNLKKILVELLDHLPDEVGQDEQHPLASLMDVVGVLIEK